MTLAGGRPWLLSLGLHGLAGVLVAGLLLVPPPPVPSQVRMHLVASAGKGTDPSRPQPVGMVPGRPDRARASEPALPPWRERVAEPSSGQVTATVPVSLDELLGGIPAAEIAPPLPSGAWTSTEGQGYTPPPLPPPGLAPPQGAHWSLVFWIPGAGGLADRLEGLDSGHSDLDRWLETYLRTVSFPPSLDGRDYQLKWNLSLDSGRPQ